MERNTDSGGNGEKPTDFGPVHESIAVFRDTLRKLARDPFFKPEMVCAAAMLPMISIGMAELTGDKNTAAYKNRFRRVLTESLKKVSGKSIVRETINELLSDLE